MNIKFKKGVCWKYTNILDKMKEETINFEESMKKLEDIVSILEKGELNLDESVSKFEEGMKISKQCSKILEDAEKRITILLQNNGDIQEDKFDI